MIRAAFVLALALAACGGPATKTIAAIPTRAALQRDVAAYAMASCFAALPDPFLRQQGQRWAGAVIQRGHGPIEAWTPLATVVAAELKRSGIAQGQGEGPQAPTFPMPLMTCGEIINTRGVHAAMAKATRALAQDYANAPKD